MTPSNSTDFKDTNDSGKGEFILPFRMALPIVAVGSFILALALAFCCYMMRRKSQPQVSEGFKEIVVKKTGKANDLESLKYSSCVVCLDEFKARDILALCPCGHVFHKKCLSRWLRRRRTCPVCMEEIKQTYVYDQSDPANSRRHRGTPV